MKNLLIKWFGAEWFCRQFHTAYGTSDGQWYCPECDLKYVRVPSDETICP